MIKRVFPVFWLSVGSLFVSVSVFSSASFQYASDTMKNQMKAGTLGVVSQYYLFSLSSPEVFGNMYSLLPTTHVFLKDQLEYNPVQTLENTRINGIKEGAAFLEIDIWVYLDRQESRTIGLQEYMNIGENTLGETTNQYDFYMAETIRLKAVMSQQQKDLKALEKEYAQVLELWEGEDVEILQEQIKVLSAELSFSETEYTKINSYAKRTQDIQQELSKKLSAIEENKDALIKNVRVQKGSGELINAIE